MPVPTYDEFVTVESWDVERAYQESRGHPPAISDMYHNAYRRLVEGWSHENILRDIKGQSISNGPAPMMPPAPSPPPTSEPTSLPGTRGPFSFPAPYHTRAVRVTDVRDGQVYPCGYSYWSRVNNHRDRPELLVLVGLKDFGPSIYRIDKASHQVIGPHPLFAEDAPLFQDEADQWYFSATEPTTIYACSGRTFLKIDATTGSVSVVFETQFGDSLFQSHSSDDGRVHSATVKDAEYRPMGCMVWRDGGQQTFYQAQGAYDECQVDASGRWLLIKEHDDNRIVDLSGQQGPRLIRNADGALGHSDCGWGFATGEDDMHDPPGRTVSIDLATGEARLVYQLDQWTSGLGHVAVRGQTALISNAHREPFARVNDLIVVPLDGSQQWRAIAPNLVDLNAPGGGSDYKKQPMANLDPLAQYACWSANHGSDRLDIFLVQL